MLQVHDEANDVLNGIAYHPSLPNNTLLLTGKKWPWIYHIELEYRSAANNFKSLMMMLNMYDEMVKETARKFESVKKKEEEKERRKKEEEAEDDDDLVEEL